MLSILNHGEKVLLAAYYSLCQAEPPSKKELARFAPPLHYNEALSHLRRAAGGLALPKIDARATALSNKSRKIAASKPGT